ncbi:hypothetical protein DPEC_G00253740 [Dallia pectoralis]|uniref:Uncharacterized protein n=1 Tax=Dallia pectoralis TaxID=75939 RepID=A0ACC2FUD8_DALPE|nr:hypothetical protein DPEC_G00253740 [Dallia pectoralis]
MSRKTQSCASIRSPSRAIQAESLVPVFLQPLRALKAIHSVRAEPGDSHRENKSPSEKDQGRPRTLARCPAEITN